MKIYTYVYKEKYRFNYREEDIIKYLEKTNDTQELTNVDDSNITHGFIKYNNKFYKITDIYYETNENKDEIFAFINTEEPIIIKETSIPENVIKTKEAYDKIKEKHTNEIEIYYMEELIDFYLSEDKESYSSNTLTCLPLISFNVMEKLDIGINIGGYFIKGYNKSFIESFLLDKNNYPDLEDLILYKYSSNISNVFRKILYNKKDVYALLGKGNIKWDWFSDYFYIKESGKYSE